MTLSPASFSRVEELRRMADAAIGIDLLAEQMLGDIHLQRRRQHRFAALCRLTYDAMRAPRALADHDNEINMAQLRGHRAHADGPAGWHRPLPTPMRPSTTAIDRFLAIGRVLQPIVENRTGRADLGALVIDVSRSGPTNVSPRRASSSGSSPTSSALMTLRSRRGNWLSPASRHTRASRKQAS
jgi:hypothetical protein